MKLVKQFTQFIIVWTVVCPSPAFAQQTQNWLLEKMPGDLEMDFALSSLPPDLREHATVYLLDPTKGYYVGRQGTNGFSAFVNRTEWEKARFVQDTYAAISYDSAGSKAYLPPFFDAAAMRASGKYTALQIRDTIVQRVKNGKYKPASRPGISYMLSPLLRTYDGEGQIFNQVMPHYMFYAPYVDDGDIGGGWKDGGHRPFVVSSGALFDKSHSMFNYIIIAAGETEKAKIIEDSKDLLKRLAEYKPYLKLENTSAEHQHMH
jgi:hypothetical protein